MNRDIHCVEAQLKEVNRLNERLRRKVDQLTAMQETSRAILTVLDQDRLLDLIMGKLPAVCHVSRGVFLVADGEEECLRFAHGIGFDAGVPEAVRSYRMPLDRTDDVLVRVAVTGCAEYIEDLARSSLARDDMFACCKGKAVSVYAVPLLMRTRIVGVIAAASEPGKGIPPSAREALDVFASQITIALENARLYNLLEKRKQELVRSRALLGRAEKLSFLGDMAARLAHEIKNPMTAIGAFIQMLPWKYDDESFRTEFYEIALEETARINGIIAELLDLAKPREPRFEPVDLHDLLEKMILLLSPQTGKKDVRVYRRYDETIGEVIVDPEKMKQVFLNVLSNAVEAVPRSGRIRVATSLDRGTEGKEWVRVEVRDNGCGIGEDALERIFEPYYSTKKRDGRRGGTGLGLFIAQQNLEEQGGGIEVLSRPRKGTAFVLRVPRRPEKKGLDLRPGQPERPGGVSVSRPSAESS